MSKLPARKNVASGGVRGRRGWCTAEVWEEEENYQVVKAFVKSVKVTNDVAERGINMMKTSVGSVRDKAQF